MCFGKKPDDPDSRKNDEIEKALRADRRRQEREVKLLLLGTLVLRIRFMLPRLTIPLCRSGRERQVDGAQADARNTRRRIQQNRAKAMARHNIQQSSFRLPDNLQRYARTGHEF
jgi:hypothetical protein